MPQQGQGRRSGLGGAGPLQKRSSRSCSSACSSTGSSPPIRIMQYDGSSCSIRVGLSISPRHWRRLLVGLCCDDACDAKKGSAPHCGDEKAVAACHTEAGISRSVFANMFAVRAHGALHGRLAGASLGDQAAVRRIGVGAEADDPRARGRDGGGPLGPGREDPRLI